jgi:hypothetical protein
LKENAKNILNKDSFLSRSFINEPIKEENENPDATIKLGDDFLSYN